MSHNRRLSGGTAILQRLSPSRYSRRTGGNVPKAYQAAALRSFFSVAR